MAKSKTILMVMKNAAAVVIKILAAVEVAQTIMMLVVSKVAKVATSGKVSKTYAMEPVVSGLAC